MLRREAERKAKEDEDRGSNNEEEKDEELTFGFPILIYQQPLVGK